MSNPYPDYSKNVVTTQLPKNQIEFRTTHNDTWVMRITADRRIEVNEDVEVTEAAKKVLDAMQHLLPPQRTWVGLTYEEKHEIRYSHMTSAEFIEFIEAKLKDKNTSGQE